MKTCPYPNSNILQNAAALPRDNSISSQRFDETIQAEARAAKELQSRNPGMTWGQALKALYSN
jgi:hypothetical protein